MYPENINQTKKTFLCTEEHTKFSFSFSDHCFFLDFETIIQQKHVIATSNIISLWFSKYRCNFIG